MGVLFKILTSAYGIIGIAIIAILIYLIIKRIKVKEKDLGDREN